MNAMRKLLCRAIALAIVLFMAAIWAPRPAGAQNYHFSVPELKLQVYVQPDGQARLVYDITFQNDQSADWIDVVDIGLPHAGYDTGNMRASAGGVALTDIRPSQYVHPGVEVHLNEAAILANQTGTLHFEATLPHLIFQDVTRPDYASLQITPTWFDPKFVHGASDIQIAIHMLPGIQPEEMLYQKAPFTQKVVFGDHAVAGWQWADGSATHAYLVGISFPQRGIVGGVVRQTVLDVAVKWLEDNPDARLFLGALFIGLFGILFFRFSGGTGVSVFVFLSAGLVLLFLVSPLAHLLAFLPLVVLLIVNEAHLARRGMQYLPAVAQVEGGGIKRGLTAPEAAVLLGLPLNKVLTLVIFGLLKKSVLRLVRDTPLTVEVVEAFRTRDKAANDAGQREKVHLAAAQQKGVVLQDYEHAFLDLLEDDAGVPVPNNLNIGTAIRSLIEGTARRMGGFDLSDTQGYYRGIIRRALAEAQSLGDVKMKEQSIDRNLEWIMMDNTFRNVVQPRGYAYRPVWIRPLVGTSGRVPGLAAPAPLPSLAPPTGGRTSFADVGASFAGWAEHTMGSLASAIAPGGLQLHHPAGVVNLRGVDSVTGDVFKALAKASVSSRGGHGGGYGGGHGGGGCACACAGCACACACAGGGR